MLTHEVFVDHRKHGLPLAPLQLERELAQDLRVGLSAGIRPPRSVRCRCQSGRGIAEARPQRWRIAGHGLRSTYRRAC